MVKSTAEGVKCSMCLGLVKVGQQCDFQEKSKKKKNSLLGT